MGFVYILSNPSFDDDWIKIGQTSRDDVITRVSELNGSEATPFAFRIFATYEVENPQVVEGAIHKLIDEIDYSLRAREIVNGRNRVREFFHISADSAYKVFQQIAILRNDTESLKLFLPNSEEQAEEEQAEALLSSRARVPNTTFEMIGIESGTELVFMYDEAYTCRTLDKKNKVLYNNKECSISAAAWEIGCEKFGWGSGAASGFEYFTFEGETLWNRRKRLESQETKEDI